MKIDNIDFYCFNPDIVTPKFVANFSFKDPRSLRPYKVQKIEGLDAEEITTKFYGYTYMTNRKAYSMNANKRYVVVQVELNPNYSEEETVSSLRDDLYRSISSSRTGDVYLVFREGVDRIAYLSGHITKFESDLFAETPIVKITIASQDSLLRSYNEIEIDVDAFPSADNVIIEDAYSTAPHGFKFAINFTGPCTSFAFEEPMGLDWRFEIKPRFILPDNDGFIVGDELRFSSVVGSKNLSVVRDGLEYNIVDKITPGSFWPILFPGVNSFNIHSDTPNYEWSWARHFYTYWGV